MATIQITNMLGSYVGTEGDDVFLFSGFGVQTNFKGTLSGLGGNDVISTDGHVVLSGAQTEGIETVRFLSPASPIIPYPVITIDARAFGVAPRLHLEGTGGLTFQDIATGETANQKFDGSGLTFGSLTIKTGIFGGKKSDILIGTTAGDTIVGGTGADILKGLDGRDFLFGGAGNDMLLGGAGDDDLMGGEGDDILSGGEGRDYANYSDLPNDGRTGPGLTIDLRIVGKAQDTGIAGRDTISGVENLIGSFLDDVLHGNGQNNYLNGSSGDDILIGGRGADLLSGGTGADRFVLEDRLDSAVGTANRDIILDFLRPDGDKIDLSLVDANIQLAGDQSFFLGGRGAFTKQAGELVQVRVNTTLKLLGDTNGDGMADIAIDLQGAFSYGGGGFLTADDILL